MGSEADDVMGSEAEDVTVHNAEDVTGNEANHFSRWDAEEFIGRDSKDIAGSDEVRWEAEINAVGESLEVDNVRASVGAIVIRNASPEDSESREAETEERN